MTSNTKVNEATKVLYTSGMLARSEDEAELLRWFRMLPLPAQKLESARAAGMALAMPYARMALNDEKAARAKTSSDEYEFPNDI